MQGTVVYYPISVALSEHIFSTHTYMHFHTLTHTVPSMEEVQDGMLRSYEGKKTFKGQFILGQSVANA